MRARSLILAALGTALILGAAAPAHADRDGWRRHGWRDHGWHRPHYQPRPRYYAPPVVVAPPPVYRYYAPPPVYYANPYYANPGITFGFTFR
ncbi:MAG: hypothetical protein AB7F35_18375 [Acetobacteraceae bacterium]